MCVCSGCGLGNGGDGVMPFYAWKTIHPGKFNGVMEVAAIQCKYTVHTINQRTVLNQAVLIFE